MRCGAGKKDMPMPVITISCLKISGILMLPWRLARRLTVGAGNLYFERAYGGSP